MASRTIASYGLQAAQGNEKPPLESSLALILTQHPRDEEPEPREVRACLEVEPLRAWYYRISPNSRALVVAPLLWPSVGVKPNTWKSRELESFGTPECSELDSKGQNTLH